MRITLVALIITIIILIILAAVAINSLTHDGLADMAIESTQKYDSAQTTEMNMLNEIDTIVKETVKNLESGAGVSKPDVPNDPIAIEIANNTVGEIVDYKPKANQVYSTENTNSNTSVGTDEYSRYGFQYFTSGSDGTNGDLADG